jgi:uncharacterized membrane protein
MKNIFLENLFWMCWNLFLAFIPLILSLLIFRKSFWQRSKVTKIFLIFFGFIFYIFLPNSPYVITDIIHLVRQIKYFRFYNLDNNSIILLLMPQYAIFIFLGFSFYVFAFQKFLVFLAEINVNIIFIWILKIINPFLMSVGIFLGRFYRFNTWDIFVDYESIIKSTIDGFSNMDFIIFILLDSIAIFIGFEILSIFYKSIFKNLFNLKSRQKK